MYFKFFKRQYWDKRAAKDRRRNCAVLPNVFFCRSPIDIRLHLVYNPY